MLRAPPPGGGGQTSKMSSPLIFRECAAPTLQYSPQKVPTVAQVSGAGNQQGAGVGSGLLNAYRQQPWGN